VTALTWSTIASLATALGTLILAVATFSAVRSSNLMAKVAQEQLLVQLRPVLTTSRREDPVLKVNFGDKKWVRIPGGGAVGEVDCGDGTLGPDSTPVVYLAIALRNAGSGIAVLHGWRFYPGWYRERDHAPLDEFERQNRDLYIPVGEVGFWQGAFRDTADARYEEARKVIDAGEPWTVDLLYGDHEGGQRVITRFTMLPFSQPHQEADPATQPDQDAAPVGQPAADAAPVCQPVSQPDPVGQPDPVRRIAWFATASRHWNIDRPDPR
jgi:hypothetical protein